jgi:uncharacterized protein YkwD
MRTVAASVATVVAMLAATSAHGGVSKGRSTWQLRSPGAHGLLASIASTQPTQRGFVARMSIAPAAKSAPATSSVLSAYESEIVRRINAIRSSRGRRPLRVSRQLSAAAAFHTNQMGLRGFFEHESANGGEFWKRIARFYPVLPGRSWSVGENIVWGAPELSAAGAVREWMNSPPHRGNILSREWREIGVGGAHFGSAPGTYRGSRVTIVTADFGTRA